MEGFPLIALIALGAFFHSTPGLAQFCTPKTCTDRRRRSCAGRMPRVTFGETWPSRQGFSCPLCLRYACMVQNARASSLVACAPRTMVPKLSASQKCCDFEKQKGCDFFRDPKITAFFLRPQFSAMSAAKREILHFAI